MMKSIEGDLLTFMVGDGYGAGFEMKDEAYVTEFNDGVTYREHGLASKARDGDPVHKPGMTTDDTQMTLAVARVMRRTRPIDVPTPLAFAEAFCAAYASAPAPGYGSRMKERLRTALRYASPGLKLIELGRDTFADHTDTCGAAMRAIPCGTMASSRSSAVAAAVTQARVTHQHPDAIDAAVAVALVAHELQWGSSVTGLSVYTHYTSWPRPEDWRETQWVRGTTRGKDIVLAAFGLLYQNISLHQMLKSAIALGGDVDTLAALCLGLGAMNQAWKNDLPKSLYDGLIKPPDYSELRW